MKKAKYVSFFTRNYEFWCKNMLYGNIYSQKFIMMGQKLNICNISALKFLISADNSKEYIFFIQNVHVRAKVFLSSILLQRNS